MCGFCGILGPSRTAHVDDLEPMTRTLDHRGPDDFGTWTDQFASDGVEHVLGLGHTRLSILDLSPLGHQPMLSGDGSCVIAFNGEIYNFRELRDVLAGTGSCFRSDSDTEVLLEAYRAWGFDAFDRLIGMFAFAIWDRPRRRLVLVRDRLGIKPLYYRFADGVLSFGSELRALRRQRGFTPRIDRGALGRYLRHGYVSGEETIYADTRRLPPGGVLLWEQGRVTQRRFWTLAPEEPVPPPRDFAAAVDGLESLLGDAVRRRLIADVPLGAFLSGGIDSSTVVSLMREAAAGRVRTFSIGFREKRWDEAPYAREVAAHLGTEHTELYVDRKDAVAVAHELAELYDEPFADASAIPTVLLSRLTRDHVTVALSGDGGDELFGGYERYAKYARLRPLLALPGVARRALAGLAAWLPSPALRNGLGHLRARDGLALAESMSSHFDPTALARALGPEAGRPGPVFREAFLGAASDDDLVRMMHADTATYLPDDILAKVDRASMSVALEVRVPILDHRVVRYALGLPREIFWHGGRTKAPLRALLERRLPAELLDRPKHGFGIPIHTLLGRELADWSRRYLDPARLAEEGHFDPAGVEALLEATRRPEPIATTRLWFLLCFERWFSRVHRGERDV